MKLTNIKKLYWQLLSTCVLLSDWKNKWTNIQSNILIDAKFRVQLRASQSK
jgi:hypothetical protein